MSFENERRDFYRIDDDIALDLEPLEQHKRDEVIETLGDDLSEAVLMLKELRQLDYDNNQAYIQVCDSHRELGQLIRAQNKKIDIIARQLVKFARDGFNTIEANISGGGLRFKSPTVYAKGSEWYLKILLFPECHGFNALARVVSCRPENDHYHIAMEYTDILLSDREQLVKHITRLQSRRLRKTF